MRGELRVTDSDGQEIITLNGTTGDIEAGREGRSGDVYLTNDAGDETVAINADPAQVILGGTGLDRGAGRVVIYDDDGNETIRLEGSRGDIWLDGVGWLKDRL